MQNKKIWERLLLLIILAGAFVPFLAHAGTVSSSALVNVTAQVGETNISVNAINGNGSNQYFVHTSVDFSGFAYPNATVYILKNGDPLTSTVADNNAAFSVSVDEPYSDTVMYTLYAVDKNGNQSLLLNYPIVIKSGYITLISNILFTPTIVADKTEVKAGDSVNVSGYAIPGANIEIVVTGENQNQISTLLVPTNGLYNTSLSLADFPKGEYDMYVDYLNDKRKSQIVKFVVGSEDVLSAVLTNNIPGDCNADGIINLIDFSVLAFWYSKPNPPACVDTNHDGIINLTDFSILAFYWTG